MKRTVFYNKRGMPTVYSEDGKHIYNYEGKPLCYIHQNSVFNFQGNHLGFFLKGWITDKKGKKIWFTENAENKLPTKDIGRIPEPKQSLPNKKSRKSVSKTPQLKEEFSDLSIDEFLT